MSVLLASGRTFSGEIAVGTDADRLWLQAGLGSAVVLRSIEWGRVVRAQIGPQAFSGEELRRIVAAIREKVPAGPRRRATDDRAQGAAGAIPATPVVGRRRPVAAGPPFVD